MIFLSLRAFFFIVVAISPMLTAAKTPITEDYRDFNRKSFIEQVEKDFAEAKIAHPTKMPALNFRNVDGRVVSLKEYRKKMVIMPFWATWCMDCMAELQTMIEMLNAMADDDITQIAVLPVSIDFKNPLEVQETFAEYNLSKLPLVFDYKKEGMGHLDVHSLPTTFIIDENGYEIARFTKHLPWNAAVVQANLLKLLPPDPDASPSMPIQVDGAQGGRKHENFMLWNAPQQSSGPNNNATAPVVTATPAPTSTQDTQGMP